jgi:hypothetical protein
LGLFDASARELVIDRELLAYAFVPAEESGIGQCDLLRLNRKRGDPRDRGSDLRAGLDLDAQRRRAPLMASVAARRRHLALPPSSWRSVNARRRKRWAGVPT